MSSRLLCATRVAQRQTPTFVRNIRSVAKPLSSSSAALARGVPQRVSNARSSVRRANPVQRFVSTDANATSESKRATPGEAPKVDKIDPMQVFNRIDANGDGVLSKAEFQEAIKEMHFAELHTTMSLLSKSLSRNELSRTDGAEEQKDASIATVLKNRIGVMLDVTVSKIFPAGFGWQYFSCLAGDAGHSSTDWTFFLYTGTGDGVGVFTGHCLFSMLKKATWDKGLDMTAQVHTGLLLGSAAFCSGTAWQPTVNTMHGAGYSFNQTALGTTLVCATFFFGGLRIGRLIYGPLMSGVANPTYANLKADAALSLAIGGATGCFVGTDISFADNWLRPYVGIEEGASVLAGSATAGMSTSLGFITVQMVQNLTYPKGKAWLD